MQSYIMKGRIACCLATIAWKMHIYTNNTFVLASWNSLWAENHNAIVYKYRKLTGISARREWIKLQFHRMHYHFLFLSHLNSELFYLFIFLLHWNPNHYHSHRSTGWMHVEWNVNDLSTAISFIVHVRNEFALLQIISYISIEFRLPMNVNAFIQPQYSMWCRHRQLYSDQVRTLNYLGRSLLNFLAIWLLIYWASSHQSVRYERLVLDTDCFGKQKTHCQFHR